MKKIGILAFFYVLSLTNFAQDNLSIALDYYTANDTTSDDPLDLQFIITNEGPNIWTPNDSLFFVFFIDGVFYDPFTLDSNSISFDPFPGNIPVGTHLTYVFPLATPGMSWLYQALGSSSGDVCVFAVVGQNGMDMNPLNDTDYSDNFACVFYQVQFSATSETQKSDVKVYPNPANNVVHFALGNSGVTQIEIVDLSGKLVKTFQVNQSTESVSLSDFDQGVYFYKLYRGSEVISTEKLIITH